MKYTWASLAETITANVFAPADRQRARDLYFKHRDFYRRGWGLTESGSEELGYHAVIDLVEKVSRRCVDILRGSDGELLGWAFGKKE